MSDAGLPAVTGNEIAIVAMAGRFPGARDVEAFWRNLREGVESIRFFTDDEMVAAGLAPETFRHPAYVPARGVIDGADEIDAELFGFSAAEARATDPQQRVFLECCWEALERAGYDSERFRRPVGVYAGVGASGYGFHVYADSALLGAVGEFQALLGNDKDYLASRVAYKLDLTGPAVVIQTACSTSLVAVHFACQGLLTGECDLALAGGVAIKFPQESGYLHREGGIGSPDGHCRAFDAEARGTVGSSGAGVLVLKRLEDVAADGDRVLAIIRGSAVNNDGGAKVGYTAPAIGGQSRVVRLAHAVAEVDPATIGYVETHGTGTALGDPIEIAALEQAFRSGGCEGRGFCAVGSVKTNIGHLDTAAGVAGVIKTVQALRHGEIPPSLHFEAPNPEIPFAESCFRVNAVLSPWERTGGPRRAGVSSFGIGGTNAHVVLEEAPPRPAGKPAPGPHVLLLAARTSGALDAATRRLADHLEAYPDEALADVAYTLQVGRRRLAHRRAILVEEGADPVAALRTPGPRRSWSRTSAATARPVVFLLPGQGSQHVGMARGLYAAEPRFRESFDHCAALLEPLLGLDLREVLWPPGADDGDASAEARLRRSELAQPALFAVEYSLARLWMAWGVEPAAMVGHSVGELVAACLAGTFGLDDALRLIVLRGRLVQGCSEGDMLGVSLSEEEIRRHLPEDGSVSVAVVNGPAMVVLSGAREAIAGAEGALAADGVPTRRLHTSHAFHSPAMEPAVEPFVEAVAGVERKAPAIPFFSNLTGRRVTSEEAIDPSYWGRHLRETVRFGAGLAAALAASDAVLLEVGPGNVLGTLARRHPGLGEDRPVISTLGHAKARDGAADREDDRVSLRVALARLWLAGVPIKWDRVHGERRRRVPLPTYPFERRRYTVRPGAGAAPGAGAGTGATEAAPEGAGPTAPPTDDGAGRPSLDTPYVAPSGELESRVAGIWEELLGVAPIGRHDDFFELGGHSLLAIQVATRLGERTGRRVPLQALLEHPTVAELAERVAASGESEAEDADETVRLVPDPERRSEPFPLTDLQQAYWIGRGEDVELGGVSTHVYLELDTVGLDLDRLQRALDRLVDRHDMLRAVVGEDGAQRILPEVPPYRIATLDLRGVGDAAAERALADVRGDMSHQVLPADRWPLFEVRATLRSGGRARIHVSFDFLIGDAWSWRLLNLELMRFYLEPDATLPPITISFRDYVLAERALEGTEAHRRALEYWRERLDTLPPAPELPRAPAARTTSATGRHFTRRSSGLDADAWESLRRRGARRGLTPSGLVAAAFCEVLAAWSRRSRFTLNLTQFNRQPLHPEVGSLVGDFTSVLLLAVDGSDGATFEDRARRLQASLWEGLQHRAVTGVRVLRELARMRGTGAAPTMPVVFTSILNLGVESEDADAERRFADRVPETAVAYSISQTPQVLLDHQASERAGALFYNWDAVDAAYPAGMLDDLFAAYGDLLARLAAGDEAWQAREPVRAGTAEVVREPEPEAPARNLLELLDRGREAGEDRVAIVAGDRVITHGGLARRARHLAARLAEHRAGSGAGREWPVAVVMEKGWEQIVAAAAILEAGAPYLPIDARLPADRIRTLLAQGDVRIALTQERLDPEITWPEGPEGDGAVTRLVVPAREEEPVPAEAQSRPGARAGADELAYVLFTSGSTGVPKGVMIEHRAAANTIEDVDRRHSVGADDRVLGLSSLSFDLSVYDLFGPLAAGGAIVLPEPDAARDPSRWAELMETGRVTLWNSVPALLEMLVEHAELDGRPLPASLRTVLLSGDWLPVKLPDRLRAAASGPVEVTSLGGATEAAIWSVLFPVGEVDPAWPSIPYGRGMERQRLEVLDERVAPRPLWATGEIFIAGAGLARGYWRDPVRTATSFVPHPVTGERLYRTGDLGRRLPSGDIEFLGREDTQVKVGGHRIELGEIEAVLARHPSVAACAVVVRGERTRRHLVAYVVLRGGEPVGSAPLSNHLASKLPAHMVPPTFVRLDALPLTANGKVDRAVLPPPGEAPAGPRRPPSTPAERALAAIWSELLDVAEPGADDSFFELGGDSVLTLQLVGRAAREGIRITASQVFRNRTLAELAAGADDPDAPAGDGPVPVPRDGELPLSFGQERLWFLDQLSGAPVQNIPAALRLRGELDPAALSSALSAVVRRHEALRTAFPDADGVPRQEIAPPLPVPLPVLDLRALPQAAREAEARRRALAAGRRRFDLTRPPLLWAELVRLEDREHVLTCSVSHVVSDGWSMVVLIREVAALYAARLAGRPSPLPEPPIQYADFAVWQRRWLAGEDAARRLEHWRQRLAGFEALELPLDRPRPPRGAHRGGTRTLDLAPERTAGFRAVLERHGATLFTGCLALLAVLLFRLTGRTDLVIGADVAERDRRELEDLIGLFVNQLVLRLDLAGDPGLGEVLERARGVVGEAFDHGGIPFQRLVETSKPPRRVGEHPFFQVKLVLQAGPQGGAEPSLPGLETSPYDLDYEVTQLDLILFVWERGDALRFSLQYARDLFEPATIDRMVRLVDESIERLVSGEETRLSALRDDRGGGELQEKKTMKSKLGSFKAIQPKAVDLSKAEAVSFHTPAEWTGPTRVARPAGEGVDLAEWAATHRERLDRELAHDGAVLFRGFGVDTPEHLERLAGAVCGDFFSENGEHVAVSGNVYTPVFYAPEMQLLWHNENSFNHSWPSKIWFACARPAAEGGETPVVDSREVYRRLPAEVREPFEEKGVMYVRNYGGGLGLDWRAVFRTDDKAEVERVCREDRFELEWRDNDRLRTRCVRPAVVKHPTTGEPSWFNQAQHFHVACLDPKTQESLAELLAPEDFPRACYFGDGSEIPADFMKTILDVYREIEVAFPWQKGDVMLVDNILAAHGRNPFRGERKILVTMGDMMSYDEIESA